MKLFAYERSSKIGVFITPQPRELRQYLHNPDVFLWIDFYQPNIPWLKKTFKLPQYLLDIAQKTSEVAYFEQTRNWLFFRVPIFNPENLFKPAAVTVLSCFISKDHLLTLHTTPVEAFSNIDSHPDEISSMCKRGGCHLWLYLFSRIIRSNRQFLDKAAQEVQTCRESSHPAQVERSCYWNEQLRRIDEYMQSLRSVDLMLKKFARKPPEGFRNPSTKRLLRRILFYMDELIFIARRIEHDIKNLTHTIHIRSVASRLDSIRRHTSVIAVVAGICLPLSSALLMYQINLSVGVAMGLAVVALACAAAVIYLIKRMSR